MLWRDRIRYQILPAVHKHSGFNNLVSLREKENKLAFLLFHRIYRNNCTWNLIPNKSLSISQNTLEKVIEYFNIKNYKAISIDNAIYKINNRKIDGNYVVYTFDDGYKDNLFQALPVFEKNNIPFTTYIATDFIDNNVSLWWYVLEKIIMSNSHINLNINNKSFDFSLHSKQDKLKAFNKIASFIRNDFHFDKTKIELLLNRYNSDVYNYTEELMMDWGELKRLSDHPLSTIGVHGKSHIPYSLLSSEKKFIDFSYSKDLLESKLNYKMMHFAFPFGQEKDICTTSIKSIKKSGIKSIVTTFSDFITQNKILDSFLIPRIEISGNIENNLYDYLDLQLSGIIPIIYKLIKKNRVSLS